MEEFKIRPDGFKEIRNAILVKMIPLGVVAIVGGFAISYLNRGSGENDVNIWPIFIPLGLAFFAFSIFRAVNRQMKLISSFRIKIDGETISREQDHTPTITISKSEITEIIKNQDGTLVIKGPLKLSPIGIFAQVADRDKLESLLADFSEITLKTRKSFMERYGMVLGFVALALMATVYLAADKLLVGISGALLLGLMSYSFVVIQISKLTDKKTKRASWVMLLVFGSIAGVMYLKLMA